MKIKQKFLLAGAIVTVASASSLWAGDSADAEATPAVEDTSNVPDDEILETSEEVEGELSDINTDGEFVEETEGDPIELVDLPEDEVGDPEVRRNVDTDLDPDLIFMNLSGDGNGEAAPEGKTEAGFGSDERAAQIESKESRITAVKSDKKGPVALVKKGRVFLR